MARGAISDEVLRQAPAARENALHWKRNWDVLDRSMRLEGL